MNVSRLKQSLKYNCTCCRPFFEYFKSQALKKMVDFLKSYHELEMFTVKKSKKSKILEYFKNGSIKSARLKLSIKIYEKYVVGEVKE